MSDIPFPIPLSVTFTGKLNDLVLPLSDQVFAPAIARFVIPPCAFVPPTCPAGL